MWEMNYFSLFCKWCLVLFLTFIIRTPILCCTTTDLGILGIFWYCSRDFWCCICESPDPEAAGLPEENRLITELCTISISQRDLEQRNINNVIDNCDKLVLVIDPKHSITATAQAMTHLTQATIMRSEKQPINKDVNSGDWRLLEKTSQTHLSVISRR